MAQDKVPEWYESNHTRPRRQLPFNPNPDKDINILLLGETGVGKTTFINAFANYLTYGTLDEALEGDMQVLIPSAFSVADPATHRLTTVTVGSGDNNELAVDNGQSQTQGCKSYVFPIGERSLRLIDTPGIGDCRGVPQDATNFDHILTFIRRYEHLNGICILLKPNDNRLNISFRYIIKESLKHLNVSAKDNIIFAFTNARTNFYMPGATANQLRILLDELEQTTDTNVPFAKDNTFLFDNESFRFLAVCKRGLNFLDAQKQYFIDSWNKSVGELKRMMTRINRCDLHAVRDMESLNEAQQLIRKLARPIGEVTTLLEENIQLAEQHKRKIEENADDITPNRLPEKTAEIIRLQYPRTICTSSKCSTVTKVDGDMKVDYKVKCHKHCYLKGVEQEVISDPILKRCKAIDKISGQCKICSCDWTTHMHVTYKFKKHLTYIELDERLSSRSSEQLLLDIDERVAQLKQEQEIIRHICAKLTVFLRTNSISPTNEDVIEYINHFIREEKQKLDAGDQNQKVIVGLENLIIEYQNEIKLLKSNYDNGIDKTEIPTIDEVFTYRWQLCELPISGKYIQQQIESLDLNQTDLIEEREEHVELPEDAKYSKNMRQMKELIT